jgi:hypothetical protein
MSPSARMGKCSWRALARLTVSPGSWRSIHKVWLNASRVVHSQTPLPVGPDEAAEVSVLIRYEPSSHRNVA